MDIENAQFYGAEAFYNRNLSLSNFLLHNLMNKVIIFVYLYCLEGMTHHSYEHVHQDNYNNNVVDSKQIHPHTFYYVCATLSYHRTWVTTGTEN